MSLSVLILGYGSIGRRHAKILKNKFNINNITIFTKQKIAEFKTISSLQEIKKLNDKRIYEVSPIQYPEKKSFDRQVISFAFGVP